MSRIKYTPPINLGVTWQSYTGTIPAGAWRTLSSAPYTILPASFFSVDSYYLFSYFSILCNYNATNLTAPAALTWDQSLFPLLTFIPGDGDLITAAISPYGIIGPDYGANNINGLFYPVDLTLKSTADSPLTDNEAAPFELIYAVRTRLSL